MLLTWLRDPKQKKKHSFISVSTFSYRKQFNWLWFEYKIQVAYLFKVMLKSYLREKVPFPFGNLTKKLCAHKVWLCDRFFFSNFQHGLHTDLIGLWTEHSPAAFPNLSLSWGSQNSSISELWEVGNLKWRISGLRPRLHEQIKPPLIAQILDPYEVTPDEFAQIRHVLFAHVNAA